MVSIVRSRLIPKSFNLKIASYRAHIILVMMAGVTDFTVDFPDLRLN